MMNQMMQNFGQMHQNNGPMNPLLQAQMMNEMRYRRLYEEERLRNEDLERKMSNLIDRIERHTENNMKIKAKYSKEIEHLIYQLNVLSQENEELLMRGQEENPDLLQKLSDTEMINKELESQINILRMETDRTMNELAEERKFKGDNNNQVREIQMQMESLKLDVDRKDQELNGLRTISDQIKSQANQEKNDLEIDRHKMQLNNEHLLGRCDQYEREILNLKEMLQYEKRTKSMQEDKINTLEKKLYQTPSYGKLILKKGSSNNP